MAVENNRYTYSSTSVTADSYVTVANIEVPITASPTTSDPPPIGVRVKLDITSTGGGVAYAFSGDLFLIVGYYEDSGVALFQIVPTAKTGTTYGVVDVVDIACWEHLMCPELTSWYDYIQVVISADPVSGSAVNLKVELNTPNVDSDVLMEVLTWRLI